MGNIYRPNTDYTLATQVVGDNGKVAFIPSFQAVGTTGTPIGGGSATSPSFSQLVNAKGQSSGAATYVSRFTAYAGYATPTDMFTITGAAGKTILVTAAAMNIQATAGAPAVLSLVKRSTANTGGTATNPAAIPYDSQNAAASATLNLYTAAPTPGTAVGTLVDIYATTAALTASPIAFSLVAASRVPATTVVDLRQPITLRGTGEVLAMNWGGNALPAGFVASGYFEWAEI